ncbi:MAG: transglycosylase domain-containing protein [Chloroflexota bacterium]|jgi:1A family penicillin-binding protein
MAHNNPERPDRERYSFRRNPGITSRYLSRTRAERRARRPERRLGAGFFFQLVGSLIVVGMLSMFGAAYSMYVEITTDLPSLDQLSNRLSFKTTQILDRNGKLLYEIYDKNGGKRTPIYLGDMPPHLINATIATEDQDFYQNVGFDPKGIVRAVWHNLTEGEIVSGASTITQQLAKNVLLDQSERTDQTYTRKLREMILAFQISNHYSKDQILEMYLNEIPYGHLSYGIEAAALTFFDKNAKDLTLAEASMLAGLPQAPSLYDPINSPESSKARQAHVLDRMVNQGYITAEEAEEAKREKLNFRAQEGAQIQAPHFVMYVRQLLEEKYGANLVYRGGLKVTTTLNLDWNRIAENSIRDHLSYLAKQNANNAALVSIDPKTGEILAMVGSKDYYDKSIDGQVNVALARRQPGSTIKPIVYVTAFSKGWAPATIIVDNQTFFPNAPGLPKYVPHNFDAKFDGPMTIRHALSNSKNIPAVKALMYAGIDDFVKIAESLGVHYENPKLYGLSLGLGAGEARLLDMVGAYSAFPNNGLYVPPQAILRIEDAEGNVLFQYDPPEGRQIVSPVHAYMITSILSDNTAREPLQGPNSPLKLSRPAAAKTGSTDSYRDSWTIGYTPNVVTGVWVGNTDNSPMKEVLGSMGAGRIWHQYMEDIHIGAPVVDFEVPPGAREYRLCKDTGQPPTEGCQRELIEVYPETYDYVRYAQIEGLPTVEPRGTPVGRTVSETGAALVPTPTPRPGEPTPTPAPTPPTVTPTTTSATSTQQSGPAAAGATSVPGNDANQGTITAVPAPTPVGQAVQ